MGRPPKFDRDTALTRATELFWKRGYVNTSVADLQKAMQLGEGSFYNAFKSKKRLYLECLKHYNRTFMARRSEALRSERSAREKIEDFYDVVVDDLMKYRTPGCLVSNSISDEVLSERDLKKFLFDGFGAFIAYLTSVVSEGQDRGEIAADADPATIARVLFTYLHGLHRLSPYNLDIDARRRENQAFIGAVLPQP